MELTQIKCPNCGANIDLSSSGKHRCPYCSGTFFIEEKKGNIIINTTINNYHNNDLRSIDPIPTKTGRFLLSLVLLVVVVTGILSKSGFLSSSLSTPFQSVKPYNKSVTSDYMIRLVQNVFGKNIADITPNDYERVTSIRFVSEKEVGKHNNFRIVCELDGKESKEVKFYESGVSHPDIPLHDFQCFPNLKALNFNNSSMVGRYFRSDQGDFANDLKNLTKLEEYSGPQFNSLQDLPELLYDVSALRIVSGSLSGSGEMQDFFNQFTNLKELNIDYISEDTAPLLSGLSSLEHLEKLHTNSLADNSYLAELPALKNLYLYGYTEKNDYNVLYGLPKLESLTLDNAEDLKDIDFLSAMPNLTSLSISDSGIRDISILKEHTNLTELSLNSNQKIRDYSPIGALHSLKILTLSSWRFENNTVFPVLSELKELNSLTTEHYLLPILKVPDSVTNLQVAIRLADRCDLSKLPSLKKLKRLTLYGKGYLTNAKELKKFPALEELYFEKSRLFDLNFAEVLNHPSLKKISLTEVMSLGIDPKAVKNNQTLENLIIEDMGSLYILSPHSGSSNSEAKTFGDTKEIFKKLEGLKHLTLTGASMDDISFVKSMPNLETVNLSRNYIKDISPLTKLPHLEMAFLEDNPVSNAALLKEKIDMGLIQK